MQNDTLLNLELPTKPDLSLTVEGGLDLDVREFHVREALGELFAVEIVCRSHNASIDLDDVVGKTATFAIDRGLGLSAGSARRVWSGVASEFALARVEPDGMTTYTLRIVPGLWLLSQTRSYRIFQQMTDPEIALEILGRWGIEPRVQLRDSYKKRRYRTQYAESDFAFVSRLLEDAGVTFYFDTTGDGESKLVLDDGPQTAEARAPLPYISRATQNFTKDFATQVHLERNLRPGKYTQRDLDYRQPPEKALAASASAGLSAEQDIERHHYAPGAMLFDAAGGGSTPSADDRGSQRTDLGEGAIQTQKRLDAKRARAWRVSFVTSAIDVRPGQVLSFADHPKKDLDVGHTFLIVDATFRGDAVGDFSHTATAQFTDIAFRPELRTPKPRTHGVESATVVGPDGDEIHTDEFGRVRVHFHWDREGGFDESSSLWIPVNQPWGGTSFGALNIPRIGQEVLVDFLDGDPDRPLVMGRVFTLTNPPPYKLPQYKDVQGLRSESTPKLPAGTPRSGMIGGKTAGGGDGAGSAGPQSSPLGGGMPFSVDTIAQLLKSSPFFKALSPNGETMPWQGSELTMHDEQGNEVMYLQAQKDFMTVVKNDQKTVIGHAKAQTIGTDNIEHSGNKESFKVTSDRLATVGASQSVTVQNAAYRESKDHQMYLTATTYDAGAKDTAFKADEGLSTDAKVHEIKSTEETILMCGASSIIIKPDGISINAPLVLINPGGLAFLSQEQAQSLQAQLKAMKEANDRMAQAVQTLRSQEGYGFPDRNTTDPAGQRQAVTNFLRRQDPGLTADEAGKAYDHWMSNAPGSPTVQ